MKEGKGLLMKTARTQAPLRKTRSLPWSLPRCQGPQAKVQKLEPKALSLSLFVCLCGSLRPELSCGDSDFLLVEQMGCLKQVY